MGYLERQEHVASFGRVSVQYEAFGRNILYWVQFPVDSRVVAL
jgi:hypothetical protein